MAVDKDKDLTHSFNVNYPEVPLEHADLTTFTPSELLVLAGIGVGELDGLIGGPPCQGFSIMGARLSTDPRNDLFKRFFEFVALAKPAFFIAENVPNILAPMYTDIVKGALAIVPESYTLVPPFILDAKNFGAATTRRPTFVTGYDPARVASIDPKELLSVKAAPATVAMAFEGLPGPVGSPDEDYGWAPYPDDVSSGALNAYAQELRQAPVNGFASEQVRAKCASEVSGVKITFHKASLVERMEAQEAGSKDPTSRARRLRLTEAAPTIRAGTGPDKGRGMSTRHIHPEEPRVITVREAARLQGFPGLVPVPPDQVAQLSDDRQQRLALREPSRAGLHL